MYTHNSKLTTLAIVFAFVLFANGCGTDRPAAEQTGSTDPAASQPAAAAPDTSDQVATQPQKPAASKSGQTNLKRESRSKPAAAPAPERPRIQTVVLPAGTVLTVRTTSTLSSKNNESGQTFEASLEQPVVSGNREVLPKGADVTGRIVQADPGGRVKGLASIAVALTGVRRGGETVAISTDEVARQAQTTKKKDAAKVGIGAGIGAAIGAIAGGGKGAAIGAAAGGGAGTAGVLATRGDAAVIPAETVLTFHLTEPAKVTIRP